MEENTSNKLIGVDLTDYWKIIYPNQWGIYKKPYRQVINERRGKNIVAKINEETIKELGNLLKLD